MSGTAQPPIVQSGSVTPGHVATWTTDGIVQDGGVPGSGSITAVGIQANGGLPLEIQSAPSGVAYSYLGFGVTTGGAAQIVAGSANGAADATLEYILNGQTYAFPGTGLGDVVGPDVAVSGNLAAFNGVSGTVIEDSGIAAASVGRLSATQTWTGANTFSDPVVIGDAATVGEAVNSNNFASSLSVNGWKKIPDPNSPTGYAIIQWGASNVTGYSTPVTFPIPFPNAIMSCVISESSAQNSNWGNNAPTLHAAGAITTAGFTHFGLAWNGTTWIAPVAPIYANWQAVGY